jgi:hypothetical protein
MRAIGVMGLALLCAEPAWAMNGPNAMQIDGGPLGLLQLSGGADGFGYALSDADAGDKSDGVALGNALVELQKNSGLVQFTVEVGAYTTQVLGYAPIDGGPEAPNYFPTSPLYAAYATIAPTAHVSVSAGQLAALVGYEAPQDWGNANAYFSEVTATEPGEGRGVDMAYTQGPVTATVSLTDGYYTGVINYLQGIVTYVPNGQSSVSLFGGANLARVGAAVKGPGTVLLDNSTLVGGFYTATLGPLTVTPEVQYQSTKPAAALGIGGQVSNLSLALFGNYQWANSPWSVGGFIEYAGEGYDKAAAYTVSPDFFGFGPGAHLEGLSVTPTWQGKYLFARLDGGFVHVDRGPGGVAFGAGRGANQVSGLAEAGVLF